MTGWLAVPIEDYPGGVDMAPSTGEIMRKRLPSRATSYWKRTASLGMAPAEKRRWGVAAWKVGWVRDVAIPLGMGGPVNHTRPRS
jgi:hypothetical protein